MEKRVRLDQPMAVDNRPPKNFAPENPSIWSAQETSSRNFVTEI